ncbi:hypothetical protein BJ741DRAFT_593462 [Chytriomyces cf. hyalinus JEL632]|nr:hypothetical protein BJ741DRAFT_593462 [Chytriomyces cf. hyalinus JEL632]
MDLTDEELHTLEQLARHKAASDRSLLQSDHDGIVAELRREMLQERLAAEAVTRVQLGAAADFVGGVGHDARTVDEGAVAEVAPSGTDGRQGTSLGRNLDQTTHTANRALCEINSIDVTANASNSAATDQHTMHMQLLIQQQQMHHIHQLYESVITRRTPGNESTSTTSSRGGGYSAELSGAAPHVESSPVPPAVASSSDPFQQLMQRQMAYSVTANPYALLLRRESPESGGANYLSEHQPPTVAAATTAPPMPSPVQPDSIPSTSAWARTVLLHFGPSESESESLTEAASPPRLPSDSTGNGAA